jgi:hypothetical protein
MSGRIACGEIACGEIACGKIVCGEIAAAQARVVDAASDGARSDGPARVASIGPALAVNDISTPPDKSHGASAARAHCAGPLRLLRGRPAGTDRLNAFATPDVRMPHHHTTPRLHEPEEGSGLHAADMVIAAVGLMPG